MFHPENRKETDMSTTKLIEFGKVSEETKGLRGGTELPLYPFTGDLGG
jgi:hypothetical protein